MRSFFLLLLIVVSGFLKGQDLVINELMASNNSTITDEFAEYNDWAEIYNSGSEVNLAGYYLTDNPNNLIKWQFPDTDPSLTTIGQNDYLLVWLDNTPEQGVLHASFRLMADGESLYLVDPDGETIIDGIEFGQQQTDISYGRECDACSEWIYFNVPTPLAANQVTELPNQLLFINEVMTNNTDNPFWIDEFGETDKWFEIYNPNPYQVNLAGYYVSAGSNPQQYQFPSDDPVKTTIDANSFSIFWADNQSEQGANHTNFSLPSSGTLTLSGPDGNQVNAYNYPSMPANTSYGRTNDGGLASTQFSAPTPRASNTTIIVQPDVILINELLAINVADTTDLAGDFEDWFELYNPNDYEVDLAGYYISDNPERPTKWQVPTVGGGLTIIPAGGYKLFFADNFPDFAWNHSSFRLSGAGEWLVVRGPDGFTITDQISWEQQLPDTSYGRLNDGELPWVNFINTTPDASNNGADVRVNEQDYSQTSVYPNPVQRGMDIRFDGFYSYRLFSASGRMLEEGRYSNSLETSRLAPGMYILVLDDRYRAKVLVR